MTEDILGRAVVRAELLLAAEPFASKEAVARDYLCAIRIEPHPKGGALIAATDGLLLAVLHDAEAIVLGEPTSWHHAWRGSLKAKIDLLKKQHKNRPVWADLYRTKEGGGIRLIAAATAQDVVEHQMTWLCVHHIKDLDGAFWKADARTPYPDYQDLCRKLVPDPPSQAQWRPGWFPIENMTRLAGFAKTVSSAFNLSTHRSPLASIIACRADDEKLTCALVRFWSLPGFLLISIPRTGPREALTSQLSLPDWFPEPTATKRIEPKTLPARRRRAA